MTVYVDQLRKYGNTYWCHMACDGDLTELHAMADKIGMKRSWFQDKNPRTPHYDLQRSKRELAIANGAVVVSSEDMIMKCVWKGKAPWEKKAELTDTSPISTTS